MLKYLYVTDKGWASPEDGGVLGAASTESRMRITAQWNRFETLIPRLVERTIFALRTRVLLIFMLDYYAGHGVMSADQRHTIEDAVAQRRNILVYGGTGTGKTTLANAILDCVARLDADHRIVGIEDTRESEVGARNVVFPRTSDTTDMRRGAGL